MRAHTGTAGQAQRATAARQGRASQASSAIVHTSPTTHPAAVARRGRQRRTHRHRSTAAMLMAVSDDTSCECGSNMG
jgi:hypothetical protein